MAVPDPIEDSQIQSATSSKYADGRPQGHLAKKKLPVKRVEYSPRALLLRKHLIHISSADSKVSYSINSSKHKFATGSDGFVGVELDIQHSTRLIKPRTGNRNQTKKSTRSNIELALTSGYLPTPSAEDQNNDLATAGPQLDTGDFQAVETAVSTGKRLPLLQHAVAEIHRATKKEDVQERRRFRTRRCDNLTRGRLSNLTAPSRHTFKRSGSSNTADADGEVTKRRRSSLELDESDVQLDSYLPYPSSHIEAEGYFERTTRNLDAVGRSDSANGETWSQRSGPEQRGGGGTGLLCYS